ncbi:MAG: glycoside hydrolase family 2 TIM barrel-domain containing protein, partial [Christensenellales bacterium]
MKHIPFDFDWTFREGGERFFMFAGQEDGAPVDLPHDAIITKPRDPHAVSGASTGFFPGGDAFYRKAFDLPADCAGKTVLLLVDGAYMNSEVRLNGDLLYLHPYGYTAYTVDLTPKIAAHNVLTISTKCVQPNSRWYSGGGLYRNVSLLVGGACYVHPWDVFVTTPSVCAERAEVRAAFETTGTCGAYRIDMAVVDAAGETVASASGECFDPRAALSCFVEKPRLWDVDSPHLYTLRYTLTGENGVDAGETRFGIRKIEIDAKQGFRLNGKQMKLRGGCIHHDNAMLGACAFPAAERRKIQLLKDAGYNAVRTAHNPPSSALLDACDELGMLVLDETFDVWRTGKNAMDYHLWFEDWWRRDTSSMVKRDRNHPSIYAWSIGNEIPELLGASDGAKWAKAQADFVRALDSTRPVSASANGFVMPTPGKPRPSHDLRRELMGKPVRGLPKDGADDWGDQTRAAAESLDLYGYNYLYGRYAHDAQKFPDRAIHATETHAYHTYDYWKACVENENCFGDFIWTAYDNLGEAGAGRTVDSPDDLRGGLLGGWPWLSCWQGDLDLIGDARPQNFYRRVMWGVDRGIHLFAAHPARTDKSAYGMGWHWDDVRREWTFEDEWLGKIARVQAYADCDLVEFFLNGASVAKVEPVEYKAHAEIPY